MDSKNQIGSGNEINSAMNRGIAKMALTKTTAGKAAIAARGKQMQLKMQEEAESDIDLGYIGAYSKMRCTGVKEVGDRLQCNYDKYSFKDPLAQSAPRRKAMEKKRKGRHRISIQRICGEEDPFLCAKKDRDDNPKERNKVCKKLKACPEPEASLKDIVNDSREFFKLIISAMDFGAQSREDDKRSAADKAAMIQKLKKEIADIKGKYAQLKVPGAPAPPKSGAPKVAPAAGGAKLTLKTRKIILNKRKYMKGGKTKKEIKNIMKQAGQKQKQIERDMKTSGASKKEIKDFKKKASASKKEFKKGAKKEAKEAKKAKCDRVMPTQELMKNLRSYKNCKSVFKERFPEHSAMIKNYKKKKKMLSKLDKSSKGMLGKFRQKIAGKIAGKVMSSKAVGKAMQVGKKMQQFAAANLSKKK
jgi:hypothetical protein